MPTAYPRLRVSLYASYANQVGICSLHYGPSVGTARDITNADLVAIADLARAALAASFKACLSQGANYLGLRLRYEAASSAGDLEVKNSTDSGAGGWPDAGTAPSQLCGLIGKQAAEAGRHGRGRIYIPFPGETTLSVAGLPSSDYKDALSTMADAMLDTIAYSWGGVATALRPCLFAANRASLPYFLVSTAVRDGFATQRRRGFFGRPNPAIL